MSYLKMAYFELIAISNEAILTKNFNLAILIFDVLLLKKLEDSLSSFFFYNENNTGYTKNKTFHTMLEREHRKSNGTMSLQTRSKPTEER